MDANLATGQDPRRLCRVLVVDDQPEVTETLGALLEQIGHVPLAAATGSSALAIVEGEHPDLVLLDLGLPDIHGYDVVKQIRGRQGRDVIVAAISGHGGPEDVARAQQAGFDHYLVKPIGVESLRRLVDEACNHRAAAPRSQIGELVAAVDRSCDAHDAAALASSILRLVPLAPVLAIDLIAVVELADYDLELAEIRWHHLRRRLA